MLKGGFGNSNPFFYICNMKTLKDILGDKRIYNPSEPVEVKSYYDKDTGINWMKMKTPRNLYHPKKKYRKVYTTHKTYDEYWYKCSYPTPNGRKQTGLYKTLSELKNSLKGKLLEGKQIQTRVELD